MSDHWVQTYLGIPFDVIEPVPGAIYLIDIAHALSNQCRYGGHTLAFYSVAQHSVHVHDFLADTYGEQSIEARWGLLHDAAEAYLVDLPTPVKATMPEYKRIESVVEEAIGVRFGIPLETRNAVCSAVKTADMALLAAERRDLMAPCEREWVALRGIRPWAKIIRPMDPMTSYGEFCARAQRLDLKPWIPER